MDNDIFQMLYGTETINKMTNLDFIIYFCESMVIAQSADILKLALGVNNSVNNDLQANFIQNGDFCNEFISYKDNQVLEAKTTTRIYYMNNKKCDEQIKLLFDNNQETLKQCKIMCAGNGHAVIFQCDEGGLFRILDPNYESGEMKCCNTLNEAISELNRIFNDLVFTFRITYYDTKVENKDEDHEFKLKNMEKEYNEVILGLNPDQLITEINKNLLFCLNRDSDTHMLLQVLNKIPENKRAHCLSSKNAIGYTLSTLLAYHHPLTLIEALNLIPNNQRVTCMLTQSPTPNPLYILAKNNPDILIQVLEAIPDDQRLICLLDDNTDKSKALSLLAQKNPDMLAKVLNMIPEDKRVDSMLAKNADKWTSFHILARYHPDMLAKVLNTIPEDKRTECMLVKKDDQWTSFHLLARYHPDMLLQVLNMIPQNKILDVMLLEYNNVPVRKNLVKAINTNPKLKENLFTLFCAELNIKDIDVKDISESTVVTPEILDCLRKIRNDGKLRNALKADLQEANNHNLELKELLQRYQADVNKQPLNDFDFDKFFSQQKNQRKDNNFAKCVVTGIVISLALLLFTQTLSDNQSQNKQ